MSDRTQRRSAARPKRRSGSEGAGETRIELAGQLSLLFPGESLVADRARISKHAALREAMALLDAFLARSSAFEDWREACLMPDASAVFDQDAAFASRWHFDNLTEMPLAERMTHREFVQALVAAGFTEGRSPDGRGFHVGARLVDKFGGAVPVAGVMPVGLFIGERCALGAEFRAKAAEIHDAYTRFARSRGAEPLGPVQFSKAMMSLGFRRMHSDGHVYCGLKVAKLGASNGRRGS